MKTSTKILAMLITMLAGIASLQNPAQGQIPLPPECPHPVGHTFTNNAFPNRTIWYKRNGVGAPSSFMTGFVKAGDEITVNFNLQKEYGRYTYVVYKYFPNAPVGEKYQLYDYESIDFRGTNSEQLKIQIPHCNYRIFFVRGCVQDPLQNEANPYNGPIMVGNVQTNNGQVILAGEPDANELLTLAVCDDCPNGTDNAVNSRYRIVGGQAVPDTYPSDPGSFDGHFQFRYIERVDKNDGTTDLYFSVVLEAKKGPASATYPQGSITPFYTGDVSFEGFVGNLNVTLPFHNVPYFFRYNYQTGNTLSTTRQFAPLNNNRRVVFDQRNNHNNHNYGDYQSDIFVLNVPTSSMATLTQVEICAEISTKHPEPHQTLPPVECGIVSLDCGDEPCVEVTGVNGDFQAELVGDVVQDGTDALATIRVFNTSGQALQYVEFADVNNVAPNIEFLSPPNVPANYTVSGLPGTTRFTYTGGGVIAEETFTIRMNSSSYVLSGQAIRINFQAANTPLDNAVMEMAECGEIVPLPVELTRFDAKYLTPDQDVLVSWQTSMEKDNKGFVIERSADGKAFTAVGEVPGGANGNDLRDYKFLDKEPLKGTSFYRLKQSDFDGTISYSKIAMVNSGAAAGDFGINLAPNPCANGDCEIRIANAQASETSIELVDMTGRLIFKQTISGDAESMRIPANKVKGLKGVFLLHAKSGNAVATQRIVLQ